MKNTQTDQKWRWGGILELPYISKLQRHTLDGFKVRNLSRILKPFQFKTMLDVCCGLGEYSTLNKGKYTGLDNSESYMTFAEKRYKHCQFIRGNAMQMPFKNASFEAVLQAGSSHHFSDKEFLKIFQEMKRVSQRYIIIADIIRTPKQSMLSRYLYDMDRGKNIRTEQMFDAFFKQENNYQIILKARHTTFPGLYSHIVFVLEKK